MRLPPFAAALALNGGAVRAAIALSVALHGAAVAVVVTRPHPAPAAPAPAPAPVDEQPDVLFVIADVTPEVPPPPAPAPPVAIIDAPRVLRKTGNPGGAHRSAPVEPASPTPTAASPAPQMTAASAALEASPSAAASAVASSSGATLGPSGTGTTDSVAPPTPHGDGGDLAAYGRAVHARIVANVRFPERAERERIEGTVIVEIVLDGAGRMVRASTVGEPHAVLRDAALEAVARAAPFPAPPGGGTRQIAFQVPLRFFLRR